MRFIYGFLTALIVLAVSGALFVYSGVYNIAASEDHTAVGTWVLHTAMHRSVKAHAGDINVPDNLFNEASVRQGARAYDQLCAACHLKPGQTDSLIRQGLNPTPPSLARKSHWSAGEKFWIIKNGIKMTGMPGWGETHEDEDLWELTAFLERLPSLSEEQYLALVQPATSTTGSSDDGHDHEHTDMSGMSGSDAHAASDDMTDHHDQVADHHSGNDSHHESEQESGGAADDHEVADNQQMTSSDTGEQSAEDGHYSDGHTH